MSLINQVLQDLEKRHAADAELQTLPPFVRPMASRAGGSRILMVIAILALVLCAIVALMYGIPRAPKAKEPTPAPLTMQPVEPAPQPQSAAPAPSASAALTLTYTPVSRLSDELSLVAPLSRPVQKPTPVDVRGKTVAAPAPEAPDIRAVERAPLKQKPSISDDPPEAEAPATGAHTPVERAQAPIKQKPPGNDSPPQSEALANVAAPVVAPTPPAQTSAADDLQSGINKQMREVAPAERAEIAFRKGVAQIQEGRANAAEVEFRNALKQDPTHVGALQALLGLLVDSGRNNEAEQFLVKALQINPRQPRHAMVLARLEVERGDVSGAVNTMVAALPYVQSDFDFYAFLAALLQREGRHREAVDYYRTALRGVPGNGVWMMGMGISLRASNQAAEARDAFVHALDSRQLSPALQEFVERQLRELSAQKKKN